MSTRWSMRHAPELACPGERGDVWMLTLDGLDVTDSYGYGFTAQCVADLNAKELTDPSPPHDGSPPEIVLTPEMWNAAQRREAPVPEVEKP